MLNTNGFFLLTANGLAFLPI